MKNLIVMFVMTLTLLSPQTKASDGWFDGICDDPLDAFVCGIGVALALSCAPEVVDSNIDVVESSLNELSLTNDFSDASKFQEVIALGATTNEAEKKMNLYLSMVEVKDMDQMVQFIGARKEELKKYEEVLQKNLKLNSKQSKIVVQTLNTALKSNL